MNDEPDRLTQSWNRADPRYADESVLSTQLIRSAQGPLDKSKGWFGRIVCQFAFLLFFFLPGAYALKLGLFTTFDPLTLFCGSICLGLGLLLSLFIWKK